MNRYDRDHCSRVGMAFGGLLWAAEQFYAGHHSVHAAHQGDPIPGVPMDPQEQPEDGITDAGAEPAEDQVLRGQGHGGGGDAGAV